MIVKQDGEICGIFKDPQSKGLLDILFGKLL